MIDMSQEVERVAKEFLEFENFFSRVGLEIIGTKLENNEKIYLVKNRMTTEVINEIQLLYVQRFFPKLPDFDKGVDRVCTQGGFGCNRVNTRRLASGLVETQEDKE